MDRFDIERQMWEWAKKVNETDPTRDVPVTRYAVDSLPVHKKEATDIVRMWENQGLVRANVSYTRITFTEDGWKADSYSDATSKG